MLKDIELSQATSRAFCWNCRQTAAGCYCGKIRSFDPMIDFVVLIHKIEARRRIATGRMSHLLLQNSHLIEGDRFDADERVNILLRDPNFHAVVLYPGPASIDVSKLSSVEQKYIVPDGRRLLVFVIDGTWATARRTMRLSSNLATLPRISFSPTRESQVKVRKQPAAYCLSTLEAIHHTVELLGESRGFDVASRAHDHMLDIFSFMVEKQHAHVPEGHRNPRDKSRLTLKRASRATLPG